MAEVGDKRSAGTDFESTNANTEKTAKYSDLKFGAFVRRRTAVSEIVGAVLGITITLIAAVSVSGYVVTRAKVSELKYAKSVGNLSNSLAQSFVVLDVYFATPSQIGVWVYNTGSTNFQPSSVRLYDSAGLVNIFYNYTGSPAKADRVYDLKASGSAYYSDCRLAGDSYESPTVSTVSAPAQNTQLLLLTIPPTTSGCPSYGNTFTTGTGYSLIVMGIVGNTATYHLVK
jgi:predicted small secreted protein